MVKDLVKDVCQSGLSSFLKIREIVFMEAESVDFLSPLLARTESHEALLVTRESGAADLN